MHEQNLLRQVFGSRARTASRANFDCMYLETWLAGKKLLANKTARPIVLGIAAPFATIALVTVAPLVGLGALGLDGRTRLAQELMRDVQTQQRPHSRPLSFPPHALRTTVSFGRAQPAEGRLARRILPRDARCVQFTCAGPPRHRRLREPSPCLRDGYSS